MSRKAKYKKQPKNRNLPHQDKTVSGVADPAPLCKLYATSAVCGLILLAVVLVFGQTLRHDFINYDDDRYVYENPYVEYGFTPQGIVWAFTTNYAKNWHPLTWLSHMLDCQLYGLKAGGHHLTNLLLHAATAILLFLVLQRMTGDLWPSAFVAAVFAIHPLRAESVAWVSERKDILSGLFFMLVLSAYLGYVRHTFSLVKYLTVMALFALGLMCKPMLVTLPFVLLLLDYWPLGRMTSTAAEDQNKRSSSIFVSLMMEKIPLLALAAASCVATLWAQSEAINEYISLPLRIGNATVSYVTYLAQFFFPADLAVVYPHPGLGLPMWKVLGAFLLLAAVCGGVVAWRRRCPYLLVGWLWYLGMMVPVIGLVQVGMQARADRYTYLPQIGLCIAFAWGVVQVTRSWSNYRRVGSTASVLVVLILMVCAWHQTSYWHDSKMLWTHTLECTSGNFVALDNVGTLLGNTGQHQEAVEYFRQALRFNSNLSTARNHLGLALAQTGRPEEAIEQLKQAIRLRPDYIIAYKNLALVYAATKQSTEAVSTAQKALELARSQGQTELARQIEHWLDSYRAGRSVPRNTPP